MREAACHLVRPMASPPHASAGAGGDQMESPNTVTRQYMPLFSHRNVALPSVVLSQKHDVAVCNPAPFFCMMTAVTTYLNGLLRSLSFFKVLSMHCTRRRANLSDRGGRRQEACRKAACTCTRPCMRGARERVPRRGRTMEVQLGTLACEYVAFSKTPSMDCGSGGVNAQTQQWRRSAWQVARGRLIQHSR